MIIEVFTDASMIKYTDGRSFGCAGAIAPGYKKERLEIVPDSTNNRSEITAVYLGVQLIKEIIDENKNEVIENITLYSDSKISICGLKVWMKSWIESSVNGVLYNYNGMPVANQDIFLSIIRYLIDNNLHIEFRYQKGHVSYLNEKQLQKASDVFLEVNGYSIPRSKLTTISYHNNVIDNKTREYLHTINHCEYPIEQKNDEGNKMCYYVPPQDYDKYII